MTPSLVAIGTYALLLAWNEYLYGYLLLVSREKPSPSPSPWGHFIAADDSPWELLMATGLVYALPGSDLLRVPALHGVGVHQRSSEG